MDFLRIFSADGKENNFKSGSHEGQLVTLPSSSFLSFACDDDFNWYIEPLERLNLDLVKACVTSGRARISAEEIIADE